MHKVRPDMDIGNNIRKLRKNRGLTQDQVVAKLQLAGLEISRSVYSRYEINRLNIRVSELVALQKIFACQFNDFFEGL
ncbi:MAG: helix-turn-helix domain-containing protein [Clostridiales bacterium]|nr:helix-turn-helix domain-containing protein [Clostridiales bacterium]